MLRVDPGEIPSDADIAKLGQALGEPAQIRHQPSVERHDRTAPRGPPGALGTWTRFKWTGAGEPCAEAWPRRTGPCGAPRWTCRAGPRPLTLPGASTLPLLPRTVPASSRGSRYPNADSPRHSALPHGDGRATGWPERGRLSSRHDERREMPPDRTARCAASREPRRPTRRLRSSHGSTAACPPGDRRRTSPSPRDPRNRGKRPRPVVKGPACP